MPARTSVRRGQQGIRYGPWEWVVGWIRGAPLDWELEVSRRLEEFRGGIAGQMVVGWGRERVFKVVVGKEVVRADWKIVVRFSWGRVVIRVWIQGT